MQTISVPLAARIYTILTATLDAPVELDARWKFCTAVVAGLPYGFTLKGRDMLLTTASDGRPVIVQVYGKDDDILVKVNAQIQTAYDLENARQRFAPEPRTVPITQSPPVEVTTVDLRSLIANLDVQWRARNEAIFGTSFGHRSMDQTPPG
jgi:hypothetical protein